MKRADSIAAASVTRTISSASICSILVLPWAHSAGPPARRARARERAHLAVRERARGAPNAAAGRISGPHHCHLVPEVAAAGEDHRHVMPVRDFDRHLI